MWDQKNIKKKLFHCQLTADEWNQQRSIANHILAKKNQRKNM